MSIRRSTVARSLLAAMLLSALAPSPASATATLLVYASPHEYLRCSTSVHMRDGTINEWKPQGVSASYPSYFWLGDLPEGFDNDSPKFEKLVLRCWISDRDYFHLATPPHKQPYTIELNRDDSFWERNLVERDDPQRVLPHNRSEIVMRLRVVGDPQQPTHLEIDAARAIFGDYRSKSDFHTLNYDLVTVPRLMPD